MSLYGTKKATLSSFLHFCGLNEGREFVSGGLSEERKAAFLQAFADIPYSSRQHTLARGARRRKVGENRREAVRTVTTQGQ